MNIDGIILGDWEGHLLRHTGPEHVLLFSPTRSGKGVGLVIPTLLTCDSSSAVVFDVKGENWLKTAGWRQRSTHCIYFNPTHPQSARVNPMLEIRKGDYEVRDTQNLADILVDPEGSQDKRDHWEKTGHSLLVGTILHILYAGEEKSLAGVVQFLSDPARSFDETLSIMMRTLHLGDRVHPVVASTAREVMNKSANERSGVLSTAMSFLSLYRDPIVARATSASDFRLRDLQNAQHPVSLYLVVPPSDLSRTKPLIRLLLNQMGRALTEDFTQEAMHPLILMLDEFPALGHLDFFESALAYIAGYNIRAFLVAQSLNQLDKVYGDKNAIMDNCQLKVTFAANDERTAKRISDLLGPATETREQQSLSGGRFSLLLNHQSTTEIVSQRQLLTHGEVLQLPEDEELILRRGSPPIRAKRIKYYEDARFQHRVLPPPDIGTPDFPPSMPSPWLFESEKAVQVATPTLPPPVATAA